ncbi:MAG: alanine--glyoxylate aminotransferase family protein [Gemmataceae bacterium]|nr:alanine--glyoxylate aminotransferase family protein [Gemmataceae bacterium]
MLKQRLMTPGPTPVPEETLLELAKPVTFHRSGQFRALLAEVLEDLKYVYCTKNLVLPLTCSGTGAMEASVCNTAPPGSKAICLIAGRWGERWRNISKAFGITPIEITVPYGKSVDPSQLENALKEHPEAEIVCSTLSETATGAKNDIAAYGKILKDKSQVLIVDAISGLGVVECRTDDWHIDLCVTGSQKALMLPAGLAFISVSDKGWKKIDANSSQQRSFYYDLKKYRDNLKNSDTPFTPANTLVKALKVSLKMLRAEGIENTWARHGRMGAACRAGAGAMNLKLMGENPADGLTVIHVPEGIDGVELLGKLEKRHGVRVAGGQDALKGKILRIAHMGYMDVFDVLTALSALEMSLLEMGYNQLEPGAGVAAAQKVLSSSIKKN